MQDYSYSPVKTDCDSYQQPQPVTINIAGLRETPEESTYVRVVPQVEHFRSDHLDWSMFSLLFCNVCCGIPALVYSIRARDMNMLGQIALAKRYSKRSKIWNIIAVVTWCLLTVAFIVVLVNYNRTLYRGTVPPEPISGRSEMRLHEPMMSEVLPRCPDDDVTFREQMNKVLKKSTLIGPDKFGETQQNLTFLASTEDDDAATLHKKR